MWVKEEYTTHLGMVYTTFMVIWGMVYIAVVVGTLEQWSDDYLTCWMEILRRLEKTQHIRCFK